MKLFRIFTKKSGHIAKERLLNVLISDRAFCAPQVLDNIQKDISHSLSKYIEVNASQIDCRVVMKRDSSQKPAPVLVASIPFKEIRKSS